MRVRHRSDLWQMCDAEYLMMSSYDRHLLWNLLCCPSADTSVDLVKDQCLDLVSVCKDRLDRQHDPGKLTTGYDSSKRFYRLSRVCRNFVFNVVKSACCIFFFAFKINPELHVQEIEIFETFDDLVGKCLTVFLPDLWKCIRNFFKFFLGFQKIFSGFLEKFLISVKIWQFLLLAFTIFLDLFYALTVFCLEIINKIQTLLCLKKSLIIKIQILHIGRKLSVEIIQKAVHFLKSPWHGFQLAVEFCHSGQFSHCHSDRVPCPLCGIISGQVTDTLECLEDLLAIV